MRFLSISLSLLLHLALILGLAQSVWLAPRDIPEIINVELTECPAPLPEPPAEIPAQPVPEAPPPPEPQAELQLPGSPPPPAAAPELEQAPPLPEDMPNVAALPEPEPEPEPLPPEVKAISPVKTPEPATTDEDAPTIIVRKNDQVVHRGHEARIGRSLFADFYSYSSQEFSGSFHVKDRVVSIIDARNTKYKAFLLYDSKAGTLRRLKQFAKYVYTIGPSLYEDEPVVGSVTFLAKDDRIERFILFVKGERAIFPNKYHVRESAETEDASGGEFNTLVTLPPTGKGHPGVVLVNGPACIDTSMVQGFSRALGSAGVASSLFSPRGCGTPEVETSTGSEADVAADAGKALDVLAANPAVNPNRVGLWGNGPGVPLCLLALDRGAVSKAAFVVMVLNDTVSPADIPDLEGLTRHRIPSLWIIGGHNAAQWKPLAAHLERLKRQGVPITLISSPPAVGTEANQPATLDSVWVNQVTQGIAAPSAQWILGLGS